MDRTVQRTFTTRGAAIVDTIHPQYGQLNRGRIDPGQGGEGAGAHMVWHLTNSEHELLPLAVVGDYLTAERVLLDATTWADEEEPDDGDPPADPDDVPYGAVSRPRWPTLAERRAHRELEP